MCHKNGRNTACKISVRVKSKMRYVPDYRKIAYPKVWGLKKTDANIDHFYENNCQ